VAGQLFCAALRTKKERMLSPTGRWLFAMSSTQLHGRVLTDKSESVA